MPLELWFVDLAAFVSERLFIFETSGREGLRGNAGGLSGRKTLVGLGVVGPACRAMGRRLCTGLGFEDDAAVRDT